MDPLVPVFFGFTINDNPETASTLTKRPTVAPSLEYLPSFRANELPTQGSTITTFVPLLYVIL